MAKKKRIRPLAICVFHHNNHILVNEGYDSVKGERFYRPLGGGIEFEEPSIDTICRELMEELGVEVDKPSLKLLGSLENIFMFEGTPSHEIIMVYDGAFKDSGLYDQAEIVGKEPNTEDVVAIWKNIDEFGEGKLILYPTGLLEMLLQTKANMVHE